MADGPANDDPAKKGEKADLRASPRASPSRANKARFVCERVSARDAILYNIQQLVGEDIFDQTCHPAGSAAFSTMETPGTSRGPGQPPVGGVQPTGQTSPPLVLRRARPGDAEKAAGESGESLGQVAEEDEADSMHLF